MEEFECSGRCIRAGNITVVVILEGLQVGDVDTIPPSPIEREESELSLSPNHRDRV
jgi:hypothetical protein